MEEYNRSINYRNDNRSSSNEKDFDMNWDRRIYNPGDNSNNSTPGNKNVYSNDRENDYLNGRDRMKRRYSSGNENENKNRNYNKYPNYDRINYPDFRNQRYNDNSSIYTNDKYNNSPNWRETDGDWWDRTKDEVASWFGDDDAERRRHRDDIREGQHRGKGPKNYTRSEERIKEDVSDNLSEDSFLDASGIEVSVKDGEVTLNGTVDSRYSKHRAEDLAEDVTGVKNVQNNLSVVENVENTINKNSVNNGNRPITTNTNYTTTKNRNESVHG